MQIRFLLCAVALAGLFGEAAFAHHSFAAFDMKQQLWIEGTVSEVQYTNPHVWIFVDVATASGGSETWAIEAGSTNLLIRSGWRKNTVKEGDRVKVLLHPIRNSSKKGGSIERIVLSDGRTLTGF